MPVQHIVGPIAGELAPLPIVKCTSPAPLASFAETHQILLAPFLEVLPILLGLCCGAVTYHVLSTNNLLYSRQEHVLSNCLVMSHSSFQSVGSSPRAFLSCVILAMQ